MKRLLSSFSVWIERVCNSSKSERELNEGSDKHKQWGDVDRWIKVADGTDRILLRDLFLQWNLGFCFKESFISKLFNLSIIIIIIIYVL